MFTTIIWLEKEKNDLSGPCALNWYDYMFWSKKEFLLKLEYELVLHFFTLFEVNFPAFYLMIEGFYIITIKKLLSLNTDKSIYNWNIHVILNIMLYGNITSICCSIVVWNDFYWLNMLRFRFHQLVNLYLRLYVYSDVSKF